ncbi:MAG: hypothetical protein V9H69_12675 [Anaerolineae bacterium]
MSRARPSAAATSWSRPGRSCASRTRPSRPAGWRQAPSPRWWTSTATGIGAALAEVDKFCTDDIPQLEHYRHVGYFQHIPAIYASLGELVTGRKLGRQSPAERTMAANLGLALDDMATAPIVYRRAVERQIGRWLPL